MEPGDAAHLHAWTEADAVLRLVEQTAPKDDPDPKALACYGLLVSCPAAPATLPEQVWLRFVDGPPGQRGHHAVPGLVLRETGKAGQDGACS